MDAGGRVQVGGGLGRKSVGVNVADRRDNSGGGTVKGRWLDVMVLGWQWFK